MSISFGPVPSRRLGRSLGINNIPYKVCTYACVYCQIGKTLKLETERKIFYNPRIILQDVERRVEESEEREERIDYITFVPDGEPTLDLNLEKEVKLLKKLDYPIAILTNASLIWKEDVRNALLNIDYVSIKVDARSEKLWRRIDRPYNTLKLKDILEGIRKFAREYDGKLVSETMLIGGIDYSKEIPHIAEFLGEIDIDTAYIAIPTRPPAEKWVKPPEENIIGRAYHEFSKNIKKVEYLIGYEGSDFAITGNVEDDILSITAVHPMREEAIKELLNRVNSSWEVIDKLIEEGRLRRMNYEGSVYYLRKFKHKEFRPM